MDQNGELRAFLSARGTALSRAAYLMTGDWAAAQDLVQETYVEMVRQYGTVPRPQWGRLRG